jgi:hypothetical protein
MLEDLKPELRHNTCKVADTAKTLDKTDSEILLKAAESREWSGRALARALKGRGIEISDTTILRHRARECSCY